MTDNTPKFTIEFDTSRLTITFKSRDGQEVCYRAMPLDDMSASTRLEFLSSVKGWVDDSSDCYTDIDISVLSHVIPIEQCIDAIQSNNAPVHSTP